MDAPRRTRQEGVEHVIPLSGAAAAILAGLPRIGRRDGFVFTTTGETAVSGWSRAKTTLDAASGVADWRLHDLRRTVATGLASMGVALPVVEKILNHVSGSFGGVAGVYQRFAFADEKREALDAWAARLARFRRGGGLMADSCQSAEGRLDNANCKSRARRPARGGGRSASGSRRSNGCRRRWRLADPRRRSTLAGLHRSTPESRFRDAVAGSSPNTDRG